MRAGELAGLQVLKLINEPTAAAFAYGLNNRDKNLRVLVYDLGGGTFDVSLLETHEGLLRVVGHDGDNFLGGRDFDGAIVSHVLDELRTQGLEIDPSDPVHATGLRRLRQLSRP